MGNVDLASILICKFKESDFIGFLKGKSTLLPFPSRSACSFELERIQHKIIGEK
jgi:hypothetical protein